MFLMICLKKGLRFIFDKRYRFVILANKGVYDNMQDEALLNRKYEAIFGKRLNLDNPQTFNEKLQWLKLYDRNPEYTIMVDKYKVRDYIKEKIGEEYLIPLIGVWDNPDDIDFDALPDKFVLKCNHNSGLGMCICKDKSKLNIENVKSELKKGLAQDYYLTGREWPYKNVPRKIIAEKYMTDTSDSSDFTDYKFFCFNGYVDCVMVCLERSSGDTKFYFLTEIGTSNVLILVEKMPQMDLLSRSPVRWTKCLKLRLSFQKDYHLFVLIYIKAMTIFILEKSPFSLIVALMQICFLKPINTLVI